MCQETTWHRILCATLRVTTGRGLMGRVVITTGEQVADAPPFTEGRGAAGLRWQAPGATVGSGGLAHRCRRADRTLASSAPRTPSVATACGEAHHGTGERGQAPKWRTRTRTKPGGKCPTVSEVPRPCRFRRGRVGQAGIGSEGDQGGGPAAVSHFAAEAKKRMAAGGKFEVRQGKGKAPYPEKGQALDRAAVGAEGKSPIWTLDGTESSERTRWWNIVCHYTRCKEHKGNAFKRRPTRRGARRRRSNMLFRGHGQVKRWWVLQKNTNRLRNPSRIAKANAARVNRGAVERGDRLAAKRPDLAKKVPMGQMKPAEAHLATV